MGNQIRCKVILQIADSPRGAYQKMLVIKTPANYLTTKGFVRQHGADGLVLHYQGNGMSSHAEPMTGKKVWEFDEGLVFFPLPKNTPQIQVDAIMQGSQLCIEHLPPEILQVTRYTSVPAPASIPATGNPVRIMRNVQLKLSQFKSSNSNTITFCVVFDEETMKKADRWNLRAYGKDGVQFYPDEKGNKIQVQKRWYSVRWNSAILTWRPANVAVRQFTVTAQYDEASQTVICEDLITRMREEENREREKNRDALSRKSPQKIIARERADNKPNGEMHGVDAILAVLAKYCPDGLYEDGWSDVQVAKHTGAPIDLVTQLRLFTYPPDAKAHKIAKIEKAVHELMKQLATLKT